MGRAAGAGVNPVVGATRASGTLPSCRAARAGRRWPRCCRRCCGRWVAPAEHRTDSLSRACRTCRRNSHGQLKRAPAANARRSTARRLVVRPLLGPAGRAGTRRPGAPTLRAPSRRDQGCPPARRLTTSTSAASPNCRSRSSASLPLQATGSTTVTTSSSSARPTPARAISPPASASPLVERGYRVLDARATAASFCISGADLCILRCEIYGPRSPR